MARLLLPLLAAVAAADELSALVLYKKVTPTSGLAVGREFNVTLTLFNQGAGSAYHINVLDDNWKKEKFPPARNVPALNTPGSGSGSQYMDWLRPVAPPPIAPPSTPTTSLPLLPASLICRLGPPSTS